MHKFGFPRLVLCAAAALLGGTLTIAGCHNNASHPDEKDAVTNALKTNQLSDVSVSQDRDKGVMTLTGNVNSDAMKGQAESLTKQSAPDYTVANEIGVRPADASNAGAVASDQDKAIEDNFKAEIKANKALDDQSIHADAKNGTLKITGSVKTQTQKKEVSALAKKIQNVKEVVNELDVKPGKHSTAESE
jgi:hyperosmotically inducible protein